MDKQVDAYIASEGVAHTAHSVANDWSRFSAR
jgi:hypothetical protein